MRRRKALPKSRRSRPAIIRIGFEFGTFDEDQ
jgi:hypothetical protein